METLRKPFRKPHGNPSGNPSETPMETLRKSIRCCDQVNKQYDVEGLCQGVPKRMKLWQQKQGGRLKK